MQIRRLVGAAALVALVGCASGGPRHIATVSIVSAHGTLALVQDTEMSLVCGRPSAPEGRCIPIYTHRVISGKLAKAFDLDARVARVIRALQPAAPQPPEVAALLVEISGLVNAVLADLPKPESKALAKTLEAR